MVKARNLAVAILMAVVIYAPRAQAITLPNDPTCAQFCEFFGDFSVFSLAFLNNVQTGSPTKGSFVKKSSPGQIQDEVVTATGSGGQGVTTNSGDIDDAYPTPTGKNSADFFMTTKTTDPAPDFTGDQTSTWDARTADLRTALSGTDAFVIYFNLNEVNTQEGLAAGQDMLAWAEVTLIDDQGVAPDLTFFFSAADDPLTLGDERAAGLLASNLFGGPEADPSVNPTGTTEGTLDAQWGFVHGQICVAASDGAFLHFGKCDGSEAVTGKNINQNLGADRAAFALFNQLLSDEILDSSSPYDLLTADIRFSRIDNGFEQLFSQPTNFLPFEEIPEPGTLTLLSLGLAGLGILRFRKRRQR